MRVCKIKVYHVSPCVSFALVAWFLLALVQALRYFELGSSGYSQVAARSEYVLAVFIQFAELCACSGLHFVCLRVFSYQSKR